MSFGEFDPVVVSVTAGMIPYHDSILDDLSMAILGRYHQSSYTVLMLPGSKIDIRRNNPTILEANPHWCVLYFVPITKFNLPS
eukprot:2887814-Amphidinium_carterae.2